MVEKSERFSKNTSPIHLVAEETFCCIHHFSVEMVESWGIGKSHSGKVVKLWTYICNVVGTDAKIFMTVAKQEH